MGPLRSEVMGQMVAVTEKASTSPGVVRFELNRALTGMGHERYRSAADAFGPRPAAELARRLFATGQAAAVHVHSNIVTVDLAKGATSNGLADVVRHLYQYWQPGMAPPAFEDLQPAEESGGGDAAPAAVASTVMATASDVAAGPRQAMVRPRASAPSGSSGWSGSATGRVRWRARVVGATAAARSMLRVYEQMF